MLSVSRDDCKLVLTTVTSAAAWALVDNLFARIVQVNVGFPDAVKVVVPPAQIVFVPDMVSDGDKVAVTNIFADDTSLVEK